MRSYWFGDLDGGRCIPFTGDIPSRAARVGTLSANPGAGDIVPVSWEEIRACGIFADHDEYLAGLRELCFTLAEQKIREQYAGKDAELLQMVRTLDELDDVINLLSERVAEWNQVRHPSFSRKYRRTPAHVLVRSVAERGRGALGRTAGLVEQMGTARTGLAREVSDRANRVMPNTSALIGGLVAARLMAQAGGLHQLSRLPASVIQVLGARTALFAHVRTSSPPPKHGIIFQHRRVHNAPREVRGKVARVLAGKLAIAARLDEYRGVPVPEFIEKAQARIDAVGIVRATTEEP